MDCYLEVTALNGGLNKAGVLFSSNKEVGVGNCCVGSAAHRCQGQGGPWGALAFPSGGCSSPKEAGEGQRACQFELLPLREFSQPPNNCLHLRPDCVTGYCYPQSGLRSIVLVAGHITAFNKNLSSRHKEDDVNN